jgi:hypothetical protein
MSQTPFWTDPVDFAGITQAKVIDPPEGLRRWWLGRPGQMIQMPWPTSGFNADRSQGGASSTSLAGSTSVFRRRNLTRVWPLRWAKLTGRDWRVVDGFYRRLFGAGPWCFPSPEDVNRIDEAASLCGALNGAVEGWAVTAGTVVYDPAVAAPLLPGGVLRWAGAGSGSLLVCGPIVAGVPTPDQSVSAPYLPAEPCSVSMWVWTASGTASVKVRASGRLANGTVATEMDNTVTVNTTPQLISVTAGPGELGSAVYVLPILRCGTAGAPDILVSAPQLEYAGDVTEWEAGSGVPRVVIPGELGRELDARYRSNVTMTLAQ